MSSLKFLLPKSEKFFFTFIDSNNELISHSQLHQDFLPIYFLGKSPNGFFVEVGVGDGKNNSNTYLLEKNFKYKGILVEPNPIFHNSLSENRNAIVWKCAAGSTDGKIERLVATENGEYSYIKNKFLAKSVRRKPIFNQSVVIKTLNTILKEAKAPKIIDFLSIDVEGYELDVLKGLDLNDWIFKVVCIEHNYNETKKSEILKIFTLHGYKNVLPIASQFDIFFVKPSLLNNENY